MFAPLGYVPLSRIFSILSEAASATWVAESLERGKNNENFWRGESVSKDFLLTRELLTAWLLARMVNTYDVYAASVDGHILLVDSWAVSHQEQLDWYDWEWPDSEGYTGELLTPLQIAREGFSSLTRFLFIDFHTQTLSVNRRRTWLEAEQARTGDDLLSLAKALEKLDEWAICFKASDMPSTTDELLSVVGLDLPRVMRSDEIKDTCRRGRPQKVPQIAEAYYSKFPDGHGALQREEIRRAIQPLVKFHFSLDSLDKAMRLARDISSS